MSKMTSLSNIVNILTSALTINNNNQRIEDAFENTLSRDGSSPNQMEADIDLNSNDMLNVGVVQADTLTVQGQNFIPGNSVLVPDWKGAWSNATSYFVNDIVRQSGTSYICIESHTSMVFVDELNAGKWEIFAQRGSPGVGTGDMLGENNLSEIVDISAARSNIQAQTASPNLDVLITSGITGVTGSTFDLVTGTPGSNGSLAQWTTSGDLVSGPLASSFVPPAAIMPFATSTVPEGWLKANGQEVSRLTYASLFAAIGETYGAGDGVNTFSVPDLRGEFVRGWSDDRAVDTLRVFGSFQDHAMERLQGRLWSEHGANMLGDGVFSRLSPSVDARDASSTDSRNNVDIDFDNDLVANTADENRPRNIALMYCIKT